MFRSLICAQETVDLQLSERERENQVNILSEVIRKGEQRTHGSQCSNKQPSPSGSNCVFDARVQVYPLKHSGSRGGCALRSLLSEKHCRNSVWGKPWRLELSVC